MKTFKEFINEDINLNKFKITTESGKLKITKVIELVKLVDKEYPEMKEYEIHFDSITDLKLIYYPKEKMFRIFHTKYVLAGESKSVKDILGRFSDLCFFLQFQDFAIKSNNKEALKDLYKLFNINLINPEDN
jgi:hypothetical protein